MKNHWNAGIIATRNPSWKDKMVEGKRHYSLRPTKLRLVRMAAGRNQTEIAGAAALTVTTYGDIERGKRSVKKETSELIAKTLGKKREALFVRSSGSRFIALKAK